MTYREYFKNDLWRELLMIPEYCKFVCLSFINRYQLLVAHKTVTGFTVSYCDGTVRNQQLFSWQIFRHDNVAAKDIYVICRWEVRPRAAF